MCSKCKEYQKPWRNEVKYWAAIAGLLALIGSGIVVIGGYLKSARDYIAPDDLTVLEFNSFADLTLANPSSQPVLVKFLYVRSTIPNQKLQWNVRWDINQTVDAGKALSVDLVQLGSKQFRGMAKEIFGAPQGRYAQNLPANVKSEIFQYKRFLDYAPAFLKRDGTEYRHVRDDLGSRLTEFGCEAEIQYVFLQNNYARTRPLDCIGLIKDREPKGKSPGP